MGDELGLYVLDQKLHGGGEFGFPFLLEICPIDVHKLHLTIEDRTDIIQGLHAILSKSMSQSEKCEDGLAEVSAPQADAADNASSHVLVGLL